MENLVTYIVKAMRVVKPTGKVAEKHPERVYTVYGTFYRAITDDKGKLIPGDKMSIVSKNLDKSDILADGFDLNLKAGTVTLPEGKRGRKASAGLTADDIANDLAALRSNT